MLDHINAPNVIEGFLKFKCYITIPEIVVSSSNVKFPDAKHYLKVTQAIKIIWIDITIIKDTSVPCVVIDFFDQDGTVISKEASANYY